MSTSTSTTSTITSTADRRWIVWGLSLPSEIPTTLVDSEVWEPLPSLAEEGLLPTDVPDGAVLVVRSADANGAVISAGDPVRVIANPTDAPSDRDYLCAAPLRPDAPSPSGVIYRAWWALRAADVSAFPTSAPSGPVAALLAAEDVAEVLADLDDTAGAVAALLARLRAAEAAVDSSRSTERRARLLLDETSERLRTAGQRHRDDVRAIGRALREAADEHSWCSEYDTRARDLASSLFEDDTFREAAVRIRSFRVIVDVEAIDEDEARDAAREADLDYAEVREL